jgi:hypothetical protein
MVGTQIRVGGLLYPFYTISGWLSPTQITIDSPWAGPDVVSASYTIQQVYFPVPDDFGYWYAIVSVKDGYRLWTNLTSADLAMMDPQRTNFGQSYACVFRDYAQILGGMIYPALPLGPYTGNPVSTTNLGYNYPGNNTYLLQVLTPGTTGTATYQWARIGSVAGFSLPVLTDTFAQDLSDGVQVYWPNGITWAANSTWVINAQAVPTSGGPRYELWPGPTYSAYLYPYQYIKKEADLTLAQPQLPPLIANRGEVLLEMALEKCAEFPGTDAEHRNIYHDLKQAAYHANKVRDMLIDLERNDEEVGTSNIDYQAYPFFPSPWMDSQWQQSHAPTLG